MHRGWLCLRFIGPTSVFGRHTQDGHASLPKISRQRFRFLVYNRHDKILNISSIKVRNNDKGLFRLNVDGISGKEFNNIDIRPNDSIFIFVDVKLPLNNGALRLTMRIMSILSPMVSARR